MYQTYFKKWPSLQVLYDFSCLSLVYICTLLFCCCSLWESCFAYGNSCCEVEGKLAIVLISSKHLNNKKFSSVIHAGMIEGSEHCRKIHMSHVSLFCKVFLQWSSMIAFYFFIVYIYIYLLKKIYWTNHKD